MWFRGVQYSGGEGYYHGYNTVGKRGAFNDGIGKLEV
jgi:hypothetical protein